jgi:preprotein translocase subunit SecY
MEFLRKNLKTEQPLLVRICRTIILITISRLGNCIPIPGIIDNGSFADSSIYNLSSFSGGSQIVSIATLGLGPYFSSSLFMQFLTRLYPPFERLQNEEGDIGVKQIIRYTRYLTIFFSIIESFILSNSLRPYVFNWSFFSYFVIGSCATAGTLILVWLSEIITERGIGNGSSLLILYGNLARFPTAILDNVDSNAQTNIYFSYIVITLVVMICFTGFGQDGARKIPIVSPKQLVGSGEDLKRSFLPLRFGQAGIVPIVFSSSILLFISKLIKKSELFSSVNIFSLIVGQIFYFFAFLILVIVFSFFYTLIILDPTKIAKNLKKMSSIIEDVSPGVATKIKLRKYILEASFLGSIVLSVLLLIPPIFASIMQVPSLSLQNVTSLILCFSIINETSRQIMAYRQTRQFLLLSD